MSTPADQRWAGRRVLVTGATGFIGAALTRRLVQAGASVSGVARRSHVTEAGLALHTVDLSDLAGRRGPDRARTARVRPAHRRSSLCRPGSCQRGPDVPGQSRDYGQSAGHDGRGGRGCGWSCAARWRSRKPRRDGALSSPYAISKSAATGYARLFDSLYNHPVVVARLFMVYGPGQRALNKLIRARSSHCSAESAARVVG